MKINTEFIVIIEAKIIDPENLNNFLKIRTDFFRT